MVGATAATNYTVEKSTDGSVFNIIGKTQTTDYTDNATIEGTVYYRIKATDVDRSTVYSNTTKLSISNSQLSIVNVYPNPMTGKTLNVQLTNTAKGKYTVSIVNSLGQKVFTQIFSHNGGTATKAINTSQLAKGIYSVIIAHTDSKQQVFQSNLDVQ